MQKEKISEGRKSKKKMPKNMYRMGRYRIDECKRREISIEKNLIAKIYKRSDIFSKQSILDWMCLKDIDSFSPHAYGRDQLSVTRTQGGFELKSEEIGVYLWKEHYW